MSVVEHLCSGFLNAQECARLVATGKSFYRAVAHRRLVWPRALEVSVTHLETALLHYQRLEVRLERLSIASPERRERDYPWRARSLIKTYAMRYLRALHINENRYHLPHLEHLFPPNASQLTELCLSYGLLEHASDLAYLATRIVPQLERLELHGTASKASNSIGHMLQWRRAWVELALGTRKLQWLVLSGCGHDLRRPFADALVETARELRYFDVELRGCAMRETLRQLWCRWSTSRDKTATPLQFYCSV